MTVKKMKGMEKLDIEFSCPFAYFDMKILIGEDICWSSVRVFAPSSMS